MRVRPTALCALALGLPLAAGNFDVQAQVTLNQPTQDLKTALDGKQGFGLGLHGLHRRGLHHTSRTRFDWNVWGQGPAVNGVKTQVSNYTLAFDHLYHVEDRDQGLYLVGGLGAVRWFSEQESSLGSIRSHTTKLGVTAGAGWQFTRNLGAEARVLVSSINRTYDSTLLQGALVFRF
jgi:hypothetical protein